MVSLPRVLETGSLHDSLAHPAGNVVVVIPAFQAQATIRSLVESLRSHHLSVVVVDDASTDRTAVEAKKGGASVISLPVNGGKGAALRKGFAHAIQERFDWILTMDADGQHLAREVPLFLQAASQGDSDLIIGNRMWNPHGMPLERRLTNWVMSCLLSRFAVQRMPDTQCGFRLISRRALERLELVSDRFEIDSELVVKAAWADFRIGSVPVSSVYRRSLSFIRPLRDTARFLRFLLVMAKARSIRSNPK